MVPEEYGMLRSTYPNGFYTDSVRCPIGVSDYLHTKKDNICIGAKIYKQQDVTIHHMEGQSMLQLIILERKKLASTIVFDHIQVETGTSTLNKRGQKNGQKNLLDIVFQS